MRFIQAAPVSQQSSLLFQFGDCRSKLDKLIDIR